MTKAARAGGFRAAVFRWRGAVWAAAFIAAWLAARPTPDVLALLALLVVSGHALRFWAAGYISRYRGESLDAPALVVDGPYAFVRNPLYIGNGLIGLGWCAPAGPVAFAVFTVLFVLLYGIVIVPHEEAFLARSFGPQYTQYRQTTGRWIPRRWPHPRAGEARFNGRLAWRSEIHSVWPNVIGTALIAARPLVPLLMR